jgi:hypothetical protein
LPDIYISVRPKSVFDLLELSVTPALSQRVCKSYKVLVGMEVHVQLATRSKMFTGAANGFGGEPNSQVDAVVLGLPGVLPVMNKKAVEYSMKVGLALGCTVAKHTKWDRKSYYYPDLPKNYQISQYDLPLCACAFAGRIWKRTPANCCMKRPAVMPLRAASWT